MSTKVLLLSASYEPLEIISVRKAIVTSYKGITEVLEVYPEAWWRSPSVSLPVPAVVRYKLYYAKRRPGTPRLTRNRVFIRDQGKCAYCTRRLFKDNFTIDHINPISKSRDRSWLNSVVCCSKCNILKGDLLPDQAGMQLKIKPHIPSNIELFNKECKQVKEWMAYLYAV